MGAGILPTTIYKNKLYFLFGKENKYCDTKGWADFGGGTDNDETYLETALREGTEELTGFIGSKEELREMMARGTYNIDFDDRYRMFLLPIEYDEKLPYYYNNNQRFLQKKLNPNVIKNTKIFEKSEIKWVCIDDLMMMRPEFRSYFKKNSLTLFKEREKIFAFVKSGLKKSNKNKTMRHKSMKTSTRKRKHI